MKATLTSPNCQSMRIRIAATKTNNPKKYGPLTRPILMNILMFSVSVMALDMRFPVWLRSWNPKL